MNITKLALLADLILDDKACSIRGPMLAPGSSDTVHAGDHEIRITRRGPESGWNAPKKPPKGPTTYYLFLCDVRVVMERKTTPDDLDEQTIERAMFKLADALDEIRKRRGGKK